MNKLTNLPPKGTYDWFPEEFKIRKCIFDTWRKVCLKYGYQEYLTPGIESAEVYRAKSGEDIGGKELMAFTDRAGRELALRPEMTPSVTRMVTRVYEQSPKPLRLFSIANFFRNERPQKGRNREFWQLNADLFGSDSINADIETLIMAIEMMKEFGATSDQFIMYLNDREVIKAVLNFYGVKEDKIQTATRIIDKIDKISKDEFFERMKTEVEFSGDLDQYYRFLRRDEATIRDFNEGYLKENEAFKKFKNIADRLIALGYEDYIRYMPSMVRGFDYYDGIIFEVYDKRDYFKKGDVEGKSKELVFRSLFGGGRYNGLAGIFGSRSFPAVGFAPGDESLRIFLEENKLLNLDDISQEYQLYYLPVIEESLMDDYYMLAAKLRNLGYLVQMGLEKQSIGKALDFGNKIKASYVVIFGQNEKETNMYAIKDMKTGDQQDVFIS